MTDFTPDELEGLAAKNGKPRARGVLPYLGDELDVDGLREWLGLAVRPPSGWHVDKFERAGRQRTDPCTLSISNGRERESFRFDEQQILHIRPRIALHSISDGRLRMPHLTGTEIEDFWAGLTRLGHVLTEYDEADETRKWLEHLVEATVPLTGQSLIPDRRHDALMALKHRGEFKRLDALAIVKGADGREQRHPVRLIDEHSGDEWIRSGEALVYLRLVEGVEP